MEVESKLPGAAVGRGSPALSGEPHPYPDVTPFAKAIIGTPPEPGAMAHWPPPNLKGYMPNDGLLVDFARANRLTPAL